MLQGTEGDLVLAQLIPADAFDGLRQPTLILLNSDFDVIATVDASLAPAVMAIKLPYSGDYYILASRVDGRSGESEGEFTLLVDKLEFLTQETLIKGSANNEQTVYYAVEDLSQYQIHYARTDGDYYPEIAVLTIDEDDYGDSNLKEIASISGSNMQMGSINVDIEDAVIIAIREPAFQFNFSEVSCTFELSLTSVKAQ
jgi:hypothetical protein